MSGAVYGRAGSSLEDFVGAAGSEGARLGRRAERETGALLDRLAAEGYTVFHSVRIRGGAADVDHVLIGSRGAVLIDTKGWAPGSYVSLAGWAWRRRAGRLLLRRFRPGESTSLERSAAHMRLAGIPVAGVVVAVWASRPGRLGLGLMRYPGADRVSQARRAVRAAGRLAGSGGANPLVVAQVARWVRANQSRS